MEETPDKSKQGTLEREFINNTTFHGLNRIGDPDKPTWLRLLWTLAVLACSGTCLWQISLRCMEYFDYNINTQISVVYQSPLAFPAVTFCNFNRFRLSQITEADANFLIYILYAEDYDYGSYTDLESFSWYGSSFDYYETFANLTGTFNYTEFTLRAGFQLDNETLLDCQWRGRKCYPSNFTHVFTSYGNCYTFNGDTPLLNDQPGAGNGLKLVIDIQQFEYSESDTGNPEAGLKILVHDQSDPPLMDSYGIALPPGFHSFVGVRKVEYDNLIPPHGKCNKSKILDYYEPYTLSGCFIECRLQYIIQACNCKPVRYPGNFPVCSPYESTTCVSQVLQDLTSGSNGSCDCTVPCHYEEFRTSVSYATYPSVSAGVDTQSKYGVDVDYQRENLVLVDVYYEELNFQLVNQTKAMTLPSLISDVGGNLGLFLGASLLTIGEVIDYIIYKLKSLCRSERNHRQSSNTLPSSTSKRPSSRRSNAIDDSMELGPRFYIGRQNSDVIYVKPR
ncbi:acid-sensing ion channel 1C-like isoform X3 [Amphiura filiformis]|uniref:acid-sensing ion channel 1C-like isoform X3 n=1 Tax=Amphiura filiformis TaxID=82378 RepID=UPI003B219B87